MFGQQNQQQSSFSFGQPNTQQGNSLFSNSGTANTGQSTMFGQKPAASGFGASNTTDAKATTPGSLFGSSTGTSGGLFGNNNAGSTPAPSTSTSGGLFGTSNASAPSTTGAAAGSSTATNTGGGLFGSASTPSGGLFGNASSTGVNTNTAANPTSGGLFGSSTNTGGGMFGNNANANANANTSTSGGLFGNPSTGSAGTGTSTGTSGGLFGGSGGLFGASSTTGTTTGTATGTGTTGGLFGQSQANATGGAPTGIFGRPAQPQPQKPLYATIDTAAFDYLNEAPAPQLYTSLTKKPAPVAIPEQKFQPAQLPSPSQPELKEPEKRKLMNNYKRFLEVRPTNLVIKRQKLVVTPQRMLALPEPKPQDQPKISIFSRSNEITTVTVNKKALEQGYYMRPSLDEILGYSSIQLRAVPLILGRNGYGQIEYIDPVDLTTVSNLGDLLGGLVVFEEGTVCVYPDEAHKVPEGSELNKPAVVTIEQVTPKDVDGFPITDNGDARVGKFVAALKAKCSERGAEFLAYTQGVWVFKVPHFSTWGISPQDMIVDDVEMEDDTFASALEPKVRNEILTELETPAEVSSPKALPAATSMPALPAAPAAPAGPALTAPAVRTWTDILNAPNSVLKATSDALEVASNSEASPAAIRNSIFGDAPVQPKRTKRSGASCAAPVTTPMPLETLQQHSRSTKRANGLAKLSTSITFQHLEEALKSDNSAWSIAAMVFDNSKQVKSRLGDWLKRKIGPCPASLGGYDVIWWLVASNCLTEASKRAFAANDVGLATTIACLDSHSPQYQENARRQLEFLEAGSEPVPPAVAKIYQVAAGNLAAVVSGLDWKQQLGIYLWYGDQNASVSEILTTTMGGIDDSTNTDMAMLKLVGNADNLGALVDLVDNGTAFLLLEALPKEIVDKHQQFVDGVFKRYALDLLANKRVSWAAFVALHIFNDAVALQVVQQVLDADPTHKFDTGLVPLAMINKSSAAYAHAQGDYELQVKLLLDAGLEHEARDAFVQFCGPSAVLTEQLGVLAAISSAFRTLGSAKVYVDYEKFSRQPSTALAQALAAELVDAYQSSQLARAAVSVMAAEVAKHSTGLTTAEVLEMPLGADVESVFACMRSVRDLEAA